MTQGKLILQAILVLALLCAGMLFAQKSHTEQSMPVENVNAGRNPNLAAAQKYCNQAFEEVTKAQKANKYDMKGHAAKAKQLLIQASQELSTADKIADSTTPGKKSTSGIPSKGPSLGSSSKTPK